MEVTMPARKKTESNRQVKRKTSRNKLSVQATKEAVSSKKTRAAARGQSTLTKVAVNSGEKTKYLSFRVDMDFHQRATNAAAYAYQGKLSELLDEAVKEKLEEIEQAQEAVLKSRLHLSKKDLKVIADEVETPSAPTKAFVDFMNKDHLDHKKYNKNIASILSGIQNRKT
ncbi:hypothetical protein AVI51_07420 [Piscirickettsia salmonis]|nr:hypothetical protein [Piscirickettsia salmonis]ERL60547.1 hypothetical protein K661_03133 [Piscirickettsia salmonis LF-89 = ATCC VR-1361]APS43376.1 hypothetical protein AVI48_02630 [Piscirickettsia salmonis]APS46727.1 hypothetical protein AVI49_03235 [Piscirickettsia salmonis]APS50700.1 hypothetical protein AVI50_07505 [Piscirickettsia salmonis]APS53904.1 hypothetical protein AVI51_07420 [Piscirickettsia salmonis]